MPYKRKSSEPDRAPKRWRPGPAMPKGRLSFGKSLSPFSRRTEVKVADLTSASYAINSAGALTVLNPLVKGTDFFNRIGMKVALRSLHVNGFLNTIRNVALFDYARIMIVYDRQPNAAFPSVATLLQDVSPAGAAASNSLSGINMVNRERFLVLMDERIYLPETDTGTGAQPGQPDPVSSTFKINRFIKLNELISMYNDTNGGTIADITTGSLFLLTFGQNAAASEGYALQASFRLRYDDI